ncbi:MAG: SusD/RagB family nutrient-binding outer membrane lipoprotein [Bacteroidales bacterium]|nr:SusD/RagB family nutrient-binding outer membrane lipoprotein [Bacteroidales bacterium]HOO67027.1 SusD/RagB family nutrient-binding outer membrane lipoprotein [Bacteroidales bacterium]HPJ06084.1 SusD/RagB family nutrient-binding outer membrane lipoprotein [Bacteroidales bacterium]HPQ64815.1 SusD/RagB family nutrient-binding outer membrane lipoprotein [Bacteroidales bacterium]
MKKLLYIFLAVIVMLLPSCTEEIMDEINFNPNNPTDVSSRLTLSDNMIELGVTGVGGSMMFYASVYIEHTVGDHAQHLSAEIRSAEPTSATTYNNDWNTIYNSLWALRKVIDRCSEGGKEEGAWHNLGRAQLLSAYYLAILADGWGDTPWEEALDPSTYMQPQLSSQEVIYNDVFQFIDDAIANFQKDDLSNMGAQDVFYGGDVDQWLKFAYALKARYLLRLSHKAPNYSEVIAAAANSFTGVADQCLLTFDGSSSQTAAWYRMLQDRNSHAASLSLHDKLLSRSDPRDAIYFVPNPEGDGSLVFAENGSNVDIQSLYGVSGLSVPDAPTYIFSYHELEFIKAEAYVRLGGASNLALAKTALQKAISAAFQKPNVGLTADDAAAYFTDHVEALFDADPLSEVMNQKYIAFYEEEALEAYSDIRRLEAMGDDVIELKNPYNQTIGFPQRFTYGSSDVTTNPNVAAAYGNGSYVYTEKVWWAGGTR